MSIRTDLAVEAREMAESEAKELEGIRAQSTEHGDITKTVVDIINDRGAELIGKAKGRYITIEAPELRYSLDDYETVCEMIAEELRAFLREDSRVLVAGLGNRDITPDAIGSRTASELIITNHLKERMPDMFGEDYGSVCAIAPGVLGTTGIETARIIKGIAETVKPDLIIAVDALAGADISRVCTTVQIADTGISPGSGVGNCREGLNEETLGVKVIAVGVPTVIAAERIAGGELPEEYSGLMVTTKDIDLVIRRMSKTVANGINLAVHPGLSLRDIESIID